MGRFSWSSANLFSTFSVYVIEIISYHSFSFIPNRTTATRVRRDAQPNTNDAKLNSTDAIRAQYASVRSIDHPRSLIRIDGVRVEKSDKSIDYNDDNIPEFISSTRATLRLFGSGFTENLMIAFTEESNTRGGACEGASGGKFPVRKDDLRDHTALVDILVPVASKTPYFICAKNKDPPMNEMVSAYVAWRTAASIFIHYLLINWFSFHMQNVDFIKPFVHQGTDAWLQIVSKDLILPAWAAIIIICCCLMFSALFSGLNLGLMSLDRTELKVRVRSYTNWSTIPQWNEHRMFFGQSID